ncbi:MAG: energy-dependent translational throttle protein EttA [Holosporaceae bacterium]|jgi:ATP-binding cassette ChvD family protein|nr:energy-dependent translational throttle protein EttA [Holosporaceae bacterium]
MVSCQYIYVLKGASKVYPGGKQILRETWLSFLPNAKIGIIGGNGAGKSTLMKIMAGIDTNFNGEAWLAKGATVGYLPQEPELDNDSTVYENVVGALKEQKAILDEFDAISLKFSDNISDEEMTALIEKQAELQKNIDASNLWDLDRTIAIAMDALRCPDADKLVKHLSGGEKRRVALCKLLLQKPDLLLLDEPTNHLDAESVAWLERYLQNYRGAVVLVTHDRYFLDNVVGWILELEKGNTHPFEGNYSAWLEDRQKRLEIEEKKDADRKKFLSKELMWIRQSPKARHAKSKARISAYEQMFNDEEAAKSYNTSSLYIPSGPRLGDVVISVQSITKSFTDQVLFEELSFDLPPGAIVGAIGANGSGKSTLFKIIAGLELPSSGSIRIGESVKMAYVDQSRDRLDSDKTVWQEISDELDEIELGKRRMSSRAYVANFGFRGTDQQKYIHQLSGGERNRVHLAKTLKKGANVILLDEPTNDLDVDTLRNLEDALLEFAGCAIVISHDRWFLDRIATHILAFEGDSKVEWFQGDFTAYEEDKKKRLGISEVIPTRIKYKKLVSS